MKRLAIFAATSGHSGVDRNLKNLIPAFAARGVQVDLLHIANHGPHLEEIPEGVRVIELGTAHVNTSFAAVMRYLRRERPDAMLTDKDKVNRLALWARRLTGVPTRLAVRLGINVSNNLATRKPLQRWSQKTSIRLFYRWADAIIVPSRGAAEDLALIAGLPVEQIQVLPNPVVTPRVQSLAEQPIDHPWLQNKELPVILGVGELSTRKDFATLVRAFAEVRKQRPCRLLIVGRGRQQEALMSLATALGVAEDVSLPGFVDNPYAYMQKADLFVLSSRVEGFGNVVAEALAVGTPVISTDCPSGPREILDDGRYGPLVPVGDDSAMAHAILATLAQPLDRATLQQAAERYSVETSASCYLQTLGLSD